MNIVKNITQISLRLGHTNSASNMKNLILAALGPKFFGLISTIVLAKLLSPSEIGELGLFMSVIAVSAPLLGLRLTLFIVPAKLKDYQDIVYAALGFTVIVVSISATIGGLFLGQTISSFSMASIVFFLAIWMIGIVFNELVDQSALRERRYEAVKNRALIFSASIHSTRILAALFFGTGLLVGFAHALALFLTGLFFIRSRKILSPMPNRVFARIVKSIVITTANLRFRPVAVTGSQFMAAFALQSPLFLCSLHYNVDEIGFVSLLMLMILIPSKSLFHAISRYIFAEVSANVLFTSARRRQLIGVSILPVVIAILYVAALPLLIRTLVIPLLGQEWIGVIGVLNSLEVLLVAIFCQTSTGLIFKALNQDFLNLFLNGTRVLAVFIAYTFINFDEGILVSLERISMFLAPSYLLSFMVAVFLLATSPKIFNNR